MLLRGLSDHPGSPKGQPLPLGSSGNPCSMNHPKDQPLCLCELPINHLSKRGLLPQNIRKLRRSWQKHVSNSNIYIYIMCIYCRNPGEPPPMPPPKERRPTEGLIKESWWLNVVHNLRIWPYFLGSVAFGGVP